MKLTAAIAAMLAVAGAAIWWRELLTIWPWFIVFVIGSEFGAHCIHHPRPPFLRIAAAFQWASAAFRAFVVAQRCAFQLAIYEFPAILDKFRNAESRQGTLQGANQMNQAAPSFSGGTK